MLIAILKFRKILNCLNVKICDESKLKQFSQRVDPFESKFILEGTRAKDEPIFYKKTISAVIGIMF